MTAALRVFFASAVVQLRTQRSLVLVIIGIVQPAVFLAVTLLARGPASQVQPAALALGICVVGLWGATIWQTGFVLRGEQSEGTLAPVLSRPASLGAVLAGKAAASTIRSALFVVPTIVVAMLVSREPVPVKDPLALVAAALAVLVSAAVFGLLVSCLFVLTRAAYRIAEAAAYPVFILGGLVVPPSLLPDWLHPISWIVSLHWGAELLRAAAAGTAVPANAWPMLAATTAAYGVLAAWLFERMVNRVRRDGTLELY
ncbi:ABC transporter permease [Hamadaea tsunoensis]|uniref:ABC transporter permease n=1 Tax=Hamadaea tsunoensis TaxID=53368 RepID=UPI00040194E1|nr:ABC transporter permease [Hamadaea tsunoensis]